jgi:hypothetical protein
MLQSYQRSNIAALISLLIALPAEKYDHAKFGFNSRREFTASPKGCSLGLAVSNPEEFKVPAKPTLIDRVLRREPKLVTPVYMAPKHGWDVYDCCRDFANTTFGVGVFEAAFDSDAYTVHSEDGDATRFWGGHDVTKDMVIDRLNAIMAEGVPVAALASSVRYDMAREA